MNSPSESDATCSTDAHNSPSSKTGSNSASANNDSNNNINDTSETNSSSNRSSTMITSPKSNRFVSSTTTNPKQQEEQQDNHSSFMLSSPNAISEAVLAEAMKDCRRSRLSSSSSATSWNDNANMDMDDTTHNCLSSNGINCTQATIDDDGNITSNCHDQYNDQQQNTIDSAHVSTNINGNVNLLTARSDRLENDYSRKKQKTTHGEKGNCSNTYSNNTKTSSIEEAIEQINQIRCKSKKKKKNNKNNINKNDDDYDVVNSSEMEHVLEKTKQIVYAQLDCIIQSGLGSFHKNDSLKRELIQAKELCESRKREIQRLKVSEVDTRASLSNLLQAVEASKSNARDSSRAAQTEARLRGEISSIRSERDVVLGTNAEIKRRTNLLEEEVKMLKSRVARLTQEKIKIERESRAALGLARSMDSHVASDVEFYRRKVSDLNDHLHSKNATISELKHQVNSYKREMERSLSQNRLAQIRRSESRKR